MKDEETIDIMEKIIKPNLLSAMKGILQEFQNRGVQPKDVIPLIETAGLEFASANVETAINMLGLDNMITIRNFIDVHRKGYERIWNSMEKRFEKKLEIKGGERND